MAALQSLTPEDLRVWFATHLDATSPQRRKFAVHCLPRVATCAAAAPAPRLPALPLLGGADGVEASNGEGEVLQASKVWLVPDLVEFKSSRPLWHLPPAQLPVCAE